MKKKSNNKMFKFFMIYVPIVMIFLGIGYATVTTYDLGVSGTLAMVPQDTIAIISATPAVNVDNYNKTILTTSLELQNSSSNVPLSITIKNLGSSKQIFDELIYDTSQPSIYSNSNIVPTLTGITSNSTILEPYQSTGDSITFTTSFGYLDNTNTTNNKLTGTINYHFTPARKVTFRDGTNANNQTEEYIRSKPYTNMSGVTYTPSVTFNSNYVPSDISIITASNNVLIKNTDYTYSNGVVTFLTELQENVTITDGTSELNGSTYDIAYLKTLSDGKYKYANITGAPVATVENNEIVGFEYSNPGSGVTYDSSFVFDTGIEAFDGRGFTIHLEYTMDTSQSAGDYILSAIAPATKKYAGFLFYCYSNSLFYLNGTTNNGNLNGGTFGSRITSNGFRTTTGSKTYTLDITFDPTTSPYPNVEISNIPVSSGTSSYNLQTQYLPTSLSDATITLGGINMSNQSSKNSTMEVLKFSVSKS